MGADGFDGSEARQPLASVAGGGGLEIGFRVFRGALGGQAGMLERMSLSRDGLAPRWDLIDGGRRGIHLQARCHRN